MAGQEEIRLYLLSMDFFPFEGSKSKREGGVVIYKAPTPI